MASSTTSDLTDVAVTLLEQCQSLLDRTITDDQLLSYESKHLPGSTAGKHLRHISDHYRLLLDGLASGVVDYDSRSDAQHRDVEMETSRAAAQQRLAQIKQRLIQETDKTSAECTLELRATTPRRVSMQTTFGRELWFASLHLVHHASLIRVIVAGELGLSVAKDFGYAPSTIITRDAGGSSQSFSLPSAVYARSRL